MLDKSRYDALREAIKKKRSEKEAAADQQQAQERQVDTSKNTKLKDAG